GPRAGRRPRGAPHPRGAARGGGPVSGARGATTMAGLAALLLGACATSPAPRQAPAAEAGAQATVADAISADRLAGHLRTLASDAFGGRAPATPGEEKTVAYISAQFAAAGLQPAGDGGGWTQAVALERFEIRGPVEAAFSAGGEIGRASGRERDESGAVSDALKEKLK